MKSFVERLWWAVAGYRTTPWPVLPPPPQVISQEELKTLLGSNRAPGGVLSQYQHEHLRGSIKLAADLLAPHFQSAISAMSLGVFGVHDARAVDGIFEVVGGTEYEPAATEKEEIDLLLSGAAWLAKQSNVAEGEFGRLCAVATKDIYHPHR